MTATFDFKDNIVLVTGSSSGIGAHAAQEFSRAGAQVVVTGRNEGRINQVVQQCAELSPNQLKPLAIVLDMEHEDVATLVTKTIEAFGRIDVLVNNAAMFELCFLDSKLFEAIFDNFTQMNLKSVLMLTRAAAPHLLKTKGCVINVSGLASTMPAAGWLAASCTKAAIDIATKTLAKELKGVRVNCIAPAIIHTPLTERLGDKETVDALLAETSRRYPIGRHGVPQDTSDVILFLASSRASFLTGVILPVAGGADLLGLGVE